MQERHAIKICDRDIQWPEYAIRIWNKGTQEIYPIKIHNKDRNGDMPSRYDRKTCHKDMQ